ncbi:diiron oxygenase [Streptomyces sp. NPDC093544]|jgi:hypothetical protein|uniref:diiron oxygenase n=1 Tax=Streptomyces sp. NPDC093544 TaxID=3155200 RepID=UPI00343AB142
MPSNILWDREVEASVERLTQAAENEYYNPYKTFDWPESIAPDAKWLSTELLSVHGTDMAAELTEDQTRELGKWESVNFYSLNVHGIRELILEVVNRIHMPGYEVPTRFFHHFVGEENEHMWFFAEFCLRYGGRIFPDLTMAFPRGAKMSPAFENFIVFSRILIFEQIVDHFNSRMAADDSLPETIRAINRIHHQDESRHIAFGCQLVRAFYDRLTAIGDEKELATAAEYVQGYISLTLQQLYSVEAYRSAGIPDPLGFRARVMAQPHRAQVHQQIAGRTYAFYRRIGVLA